jgi:hypothetical protein
MNNWLFALVVLGIGLLLAFLVDRLKARPGPSAARRERRKWLYYWFAGRYPTKEEMEEEEREDNDKK